MLAAAEPANPIFDAMVRHQWLFPATECVHIASFALAIGTIAVVDLSLLDLGFGRKSAAALLRTTEIWTLVGLTLIIFSGLMLFASDPDHYFANAAFRVKIPALVLALLWNYTVHRKAVLSNNSGIVSKLVAVISLALWVSVVFGGLWIGFTR